jgi:transposase
MHYSTDLSDGQFNLLCKYLPRVKLTKPCIYTKHQLLNGICYVLKTGCQWRLLPKEYPPFRTVHKYFRKLCVLGVMEKLQFELNLMSLARCNSSRDNNTLKLIIDSKSVDSSELLESKYAGTDGHKLVKGLKLFELVDCQGRCWRSLTCPANTSEIVGAMTIIDRTFNSKQKPIVKFILGDKAFNGDKFEKEIYTKHGIVVLGLQKETNKKFELNEEKEHRLKQKEFKERIIKPHRYKVERNFAHLMLARRLTRVWERKSKSYETFVKFRHILLLLKKLVN